MSAGYHPGAYARGEGWLRLNRNENLFVDRELHVRLLERAVSRTALGTYPDAESTGVRNKLAVLHGTSLDNIYVGNGSDGVISDLLLLMKEQFEEIWLPAIGYRVYRLVADRVGLRVRYYQSREVDVPADRPVFVVADSPNAITGQTVDPSHFRRVLAQPASVVIWDNVYGDFDEEVPPRLQEANFIVLRSFSKFYAMAGYRIGYALMNSQLVDRLQQRKDVYGVNVLAQEVAEEALDERATFKRAADQMRAARQMVRTEFQNRGFVCPPSEGNFVFITHPSEDLGALCAALQRVQVLVRHFNEPALARSLRVTIPPAEMVHRLFSNVDACREASVLLPAEA